MRLAVTAVNLAMGLAYLGVGSAVAWDLYRERESQGRALGYALVAMAVTCGPHHLEHGIHLWTAPTASATWLELAVVTVGLPAGAIYTWLAFERLRGGDGDRLVAGTPRWLAALALAGIAYLVVASAVVIDQLGAVDRWQQLLLPNLLLVGIYAAIGLVLFGTQVAQRPASGSWSLAGLALASVFPTCAVMHGTWVLYGATGHYTGDVHLLFIDWLSVPAGVYFLAVVRDLRRSTRAAWESDVLGSAAPV